MEEEILNMMFIYWNRNYISTLLINKYMSYKEFVNSKDYQFKMMVVVVYQCLVVNGKELRIIKSASLIDKKKLFKMFVKYIVSGEDRNISKEVIDKMPLEYRLFTL